MEIIYVLAARAEVLEARIGRARRQAGFHEQRAEQSGDEREQL